MRLNNKVAIVTGGRGLYGASISTGLCEMGATVVIASRSGEKCEEYAKTLRDQGYEAYALKVTFDKWAYLNEMEVFQFEREAVETPETPSEPDTTNDEDR